MVAGPRSVCSGAEACSGVHAAAALVVSGTAPPKNRCHSGAQRLCLWILKPCRALNPALRGAWRCGRCSFLFRVALFAGPGAFCQPPPAGVASDCSGRNQ